MEGLAFVKVFSVLGISCTSEDLLISFVLRGENLIKPIL